MMRRNDPSRSIRNANARHARALRKLIGTDVTLYHGERVKLVEIRGASAIVEAKLIASRRRVAVNSIIEERGS